MGKLYNDLLNAFEEIGEIENNKSLVDAVKEQRKQDDILHITEQEAEKLYDKYSDCMKKLENDTNNEDDNFDDVFLTKGLNLGHIKEGKVCGQDNKLCYQLDRTIAIFLRDSLKSFAKNNDGYPAKYNQYLHDLIDMKNKGTITKKAFEILYKKVYNSWKNKLLELSEEFNQSLKYYAHAFEKGLTQKQRDEDFEMSKKILQIAIYDLSSVITDLNY